MRKSLKLKENLKLEIEGCHYEVRGFSENNSTRGIFAVYDLGKNGYNAEYIAEICYSSKDGLGWYITDMPPFHVRTNEIYVEHTEFELRFILQVIDEIKKALGLK